MKVRFTLEALTHIAAIRFYIEGQPRTPAISTCFAGAAGSLLKILWHDGIGMSLCAKRLERGRFIWPSADSGVVLISTSQLACMLDGIDWRNPQHTWRPTAPG
jgi:transposase